MLPLPIPPATALAEVITPALRLLPGKLTNAPARVMLLAIALQESGLAAREQMAGGPARGLWQFERGGVRGVLEHPASAALAAALCAARGVPATSYSVHASLAGDDVLAAGIARLLLWTDAAPLPPLDADPDAGWAYYLRSWRPGRPRPREWAAHWSRASLAVRAML